jgi:ATP-binding cassette subfamily B protein
MSKPSPLFRLLRYARQRRGRIWTATSYSLLNKAFDLAPPFLIGAALDVVVRREGSFLAGFGVTGLDAQLYVIAALTIFIWSAESLFEYLLSVCWRGLAQDLQHELRLDAYAHMQRLELAYFEQRPTGDLMAVLNDDINQLERFLDVGANDLIQVAFTTLAIAVTFFLMAPEVAWLAMLPIPVVIWGSFHWQRLLAPRYADVRERAGLLNGQLANNLGGIATIKSFVNEDSRDATHRRTERELSRGQPQGDPAELGVYAADPLRDSLWLPRDAAAWWWSRAGRGARGRALRDDDLPHAAPALAADPARADF